MPSSQVMPSKSPLYKATGSSILTAGKNTPSTLLEEQSALTSPGSRLGLGQDTPLGCPQLPSRAVPEEVRQDSTAISCV